GRKLTMVKSRGSYAARCDGQAVHKDCPGCGRIQADLVHAHVLEETAVWALGPAERRLGDRDRRESDRQHRRAALAAQVDRLSAGVGALAAKLATGDVSQEAYEA